MRHRQGQKVKGRKVARSHKHWAQNIKIHASNVIR